MLTPREREALIHVVSGKQNKQIASELGTEENAIKIHRENLKAKSLTGLMKLASP
jgi:FixJ family two-component response regulator